MQNIIKSIYHMQKEMKYVYVSSIAKIIAGECPFKIWHEIRISKKESDNLRRWKEAHDTFLDNWSKKLKEEGWIIVRERSIEYEGFRGRIDIIGKKNGHVKIWEIKTGKEYPFHNIQAVLYYIIEKKRGNMKISAVVQYLDNHYEIDEKDYNGIWNEALKAKSMLLNDNPPKEKIPSGLCKFCDLREDCEYWTDI